MKKDYIVELREEEADELMDDHWVGELVRCKDCKYYEQKEHWANFGGVPILATEMPTCSKWADGDCATRPDGYCFLAERRDSP